MSSIDEPPRIAPGFPYSSPDDSLGTPVPRNARGTLNHRDLPRSHSPFTRSNSPLGSFTYKGPQLRMGSYAPQFLLLRTRASRGLLWTDPDCPHGLSRTDLVCSSDLQIPEGIWLPGAKLTSRRRASLCSPPGHPESYSSFPRGPGQRPRLTFY